MPPGILSRGHRGAQRLSANGIRVRISCVIGRAGASPPSRNRRAIFMCDRPCDGTDTVISISPSRVTSCACAQSLSPSFVKNHNLKEYLHVTTLRQRSLDRGKRGALSEASTTSCQRISRSRECQGKRKAPVEPPCHCTTTRNSDWFFYYRVKEFFLFSYYNSAIICMYVYSSLDVKLSMVTRVADQLRLVGSLPLAQNA